MKAINEFKEFAIKGNVVDMAVGVVIGAGFGKIVSSLVGDIITPVLGVLVGGVNFTNLKVTIKDAVNDKPPVTWRAGQPILISMIWAPAASASAAPLAIHCASRPTNCTTISGKPSPTAARRTTSGRPAAN